MIQENIYIDGLGYRNPIKELDQIKWYLNQIASSKPKGHDTRFWLDLRERYYKRLINLEAYELIDFILKKATDEKERKRIASRKKSKEIAEQELADFMKRYKADKMVRELTKTISKN